MEHNTPEKVCKDCGQSFPRTREYFFYSKDQIGTYCKPCHRARNRKWGQSNPERKREQAIAFRAKNLERERERHRRHYAANTARRKLAIRKSYRKHRERRCAKQNEQRRNNRAVESERAKVYRASLDPIIKKERAGLARAKRKGVFIEHVSYEAIYERDGKRCYMCQKELARDAAVFDHVKPMAAGGIHSNLNIKLACYACNRSKGTRLDMRWIRYMKSA